MLFTFLTSNGQHKAFPPLINLELNQVRKVKSNNTPLDLYYSNLADILEVILLEDKNKFDQLSDNQDTRIDILDNIDEASPWKNFVKAEIQLQWAFVDFKKGDDWSAFWGLRRAYRSIKRNVKKYPNFEPNNRTLGLLNIIFGNVPSKNQWIMNLFGLRGDIFDGIEQLNNITDTYPEFKLEAKLILSMVQTYLLEDFNEATRILPDSYKGASLINYVKALVYLKAHNASEARTLLATEIQKVPFYNYLIAETYFQEGDYSEAIRFYKKFLNQFHGTSYLKDTYLKLAMSNAFIDRLDLYQSYLIKCRTEGEENSEIDKNAIKILNSLDNQNPTALKIRFAIDGGFYQQADTLITSLENNDISAYENLELTYRKARMNHLKGDSTLALKFYRIVIDKAEAISETYYAPNSFLQIGYLMRQQGQYNSARMYFERVLKFKKHPYKNSLDSKAKIALKSLSIKSD